ncbi:MAG: electron transfer flavoprotein subunit alpha [Bacteroidetes bacterium]|nr:electron transfer flavoprotein subunit alpha [Bacteroidota bacterium]|tara:strand:- start:738 stop:1481 length:744 start_codon:yes stop_codon:yes gene_type:complete
MKILICLSNVPDTTTKIKLAGDNSAVEKAGVQWIINPWDELALTRALELKEASGGAITSVTVVTVGGADVEPTMRKGLAIGADDAIRIDAEPKDAYYVAAQIAEVAKDFDIVMTGIESSDYNSSAVGGMLSEFLNVPSVSSVSKMEIEGGDINVTREIDGGSEIVNVATPFVAIVQKGITKEPRIPAMRGIMMARKKPLNVVAAAEVEALTEFVSYELPAAKAACKMVDAENVSELVSLLKNEAKVL